MHKIMILTAFISVAPFIPARADTSVICRVADPTGTPLNIRMQPNGEIVATARNGDKILVFRGDEKRDSKGRVWLLVALKTSEAPDGYVIASYVRCPW
jgi:hypothetical protein